MFSNAGQLITNEIPQDVDLSGDTDGDGMSDRLELYAGFDPSDAASRFSVQAGQLSGSDPNTVVITWSSASGCFYSMYRATNMLASFELLRMHIPATAPVNSYTDHVSSVQSYYRIETE